MKGKEKEDGEKKSKLGQLDGKWNIFMCSITLLP